MSLPLDARGAVSAGGDDGGGGDGQHVLTVAPSPHQTLRAR